MSFEEVQLLAFSDELRKIAQSKEAGWMAKAIESGAERMGTGQLSSLAARLGARASRAAKPGTLGPKAIGHFVDAHQASEAAKSALGTMRGRLAQTALQARPAAVRVLP